MEHCEAILTPIEQPKCVNYDQCAEALQTLLEKVEYVTNIVNDIIDRWSEFEQS